MAQGTLLVLDEPTNHLDIPSKEMLEEALQRFDGSVIAVSHDRYFLRRIATRVVTVRFFVGGHSDEAATSCAARARALSWCAAAQPVSPLLLRLQRGGVSLENSLHAVLRGYRSHISSIRVGLANSMKSGRVSACCLARCAYAGLLRRSSDMCFNARFALGRRARVASRGTTRSLFPWKRPWLDLDSDWTQTLTVLVAAQVENYKLRDYEGNYEEFLEKNEDEAEKMAVKEERVKEIEKAR